ncbi:glycine receptor subunit alpha-2-like isoform X2 [Lineus longissimus]
MEIKVDVYFRQSWLDPRLVYNATSGIKAPITLRPHHLHDIWRPDAVFVNERRGARHDITVPNIYIRLHPNGTINFSQRLTLTLSCPMDLHNFPMDKQDCPIRIESYNYYENELIFIFTEREAVSFRENSSIPEYFFDKKADIGNCTSHYATGDYSCIEAVFHLRRDFGYYFIQVYVPCFLIVGLSWISFMLDVHATPARVSLGLLTVLTMTTQSTGSRAQLPRVSYVNAMDVWLATCLVFVFAALLEYSVANVLARWEDQALKTALLKEDALKLPGEIHVMPGLRERKDSKAMEDSILKLFKVLNVDEGQPSWDKSYKSRTSYKIEYAARILFPIAFLIFNIFYWLYYVEQ